MKNFAKFPLLTDTKRRSRKDTRGWASKEEDRVREQKWKQHQGRERVAFLILFNSRRSIVAGREAKVHHHLGPFNARFLSERAEQPVGCSKE
jgi:hypothetical protein